MSFNFANPSPLLSPFIKQYWALETNAHANKEHMQRIVPNGLMELTIYLGEKPAVVDPEKTIHENTTLSGQLNKFYDLKIKGHLSLFSISFLPYGAMMFFNVPLNELYNKNIPLKLIVGNKIISLEERLYETKSFEGKVQLVESFLIAQLHKHHKSYELKRIYNTIFEINKYHGLLNVDTLAENACLGRKQFERTFLDHIGTTPKQFLKIVRFQNAIFQKQINNTLSLTELAHLCGYYDQAHMVNDFKSISGMTPKQYFSDCKPYSDYFS